MPAGDALVAPTARGVFASSDTQWELKAGLGLGALDASAAVATLAGEAAQLNYPRAHLVTFHEGALWMVGAVETNAALLRSDSLGERWTVLPAPKIDSGEVEPTAPPPVQAAEPPRLQSSGTDLFVIGTGDVWRLAGTGGVPQWESIGLEGLPRPSDGLPPAIRNYLPRATHRPFEMLTVLTDQLLIYRRTELDDPWVLTATMAVVDRELVGSATSDAVFIISPNAIQRTDDQGESWFRFWPVSHPSIEAFALLPRQDGHPADMLVGAADGSIWVSRDAGATWRQARPRDEDGRAITGLVQHRTGLWASTLGRGMLYSGDGGDSWAPRNAGLRAARPFDVAFTAAQDLLLATRAGLVQLSGDPDSGNWAVIDERAVTAVRVDPFSNRSVAGTVRGDLTARADDRPTAVTTFPFAERHQISFIPTHLGPLEVDAQAVVAVAPRDDGRRWLAWSRARGGAKSDDGGASWTRLELSEGLKSALATTVVRQLVADAGDTIYLLDENPDARAPALLWRSDDDGKSWTTVHAFGRQRASHVVLRTRPPNYPGVLFAANGDELLRSEDFGKTWRQLAGPWHGNRIISLAMQEDRATLLVDARRHLEVVTLERLDAPQPLISQHALTFPDDVQVDAQDVARFSAAGRRIVLTDRHRVWMGTLPEGPRGIGEGMATVATLAGTLLLIGIAFLWMRAASAR